MSTVSFVNKLANQSEFANQANPAVVSPVKAKPKGNLLLLKTLDVLENLLPLNASSSSPSASLNTL